MRPLLYSLRARRARGSFIDLSREISPASVGAARTDKPKNGQREIAGQKMVNLLGCARCNKTHRRRSRWDQWEFALDQNWCCWLQCYLGATILVQIGNGRHVLAKRTMAFFHRIYLIIPPTFFKCSLSFVKKNAAPIWLPRYLHYKLKIMHTQINFYLIS